MLTTDLTLCVACTGITPGEVCMFRSLGFIWIRSELVFGYCILSDWQACT
jgi:hypothetical protein